MSDTVPCPTCKKPLPIPTDSLPPHFPFCSERCRLIDLGRWADGSYVIPGPALTDDDEA